MRIETSPEVSRANLIQLLRASEAITDFDDKEIEDLANRAEFRFYKQGDIIINKGEPGNEVFFILSGQVRALNTNISPPRLLNYHWRGQFFGERALLTGEPRATTIDVVADAQVAIFDRRDWEEALVGPHPRLRNYFETLKHRYEDPRTYNFAGRQWDEVAVVNTNRHILALLLTFIGPTLMLIIGLITVVFMLISQTLSSTVILSGLIPYILIILGWYLYSYVDWENDDFIVSNKRVIHIERTILYGEHRYEAPLSEIQDVTLEARGFIARALDFYDIIIQTAGAGSIVFDGIRNGDEIQRTIFEERQRVKERIEAADLGSIRRSLATRMEWDVLSSTVAPIDVTPAPMKIEDTRELPGLLGYLWPRTRVVEGEKITWRKHFFILLQAIAAPLAAFLVVSYLVLASFLLTIPFGGFNRINFPLSAVLVGLWFFTILWYLWQYDDWRKDVYIVTDTEIIDVQSSAFRLMGEKARQGTFDVVQNIRFNTPNFFARLLNMGDVTIETAGTAETFTFVQVYNPAEVQQEVFRRWVNFKEKKRREARRAEEARFTQWLYEYNEMREMRQKGQQ